MVGRGRGIKCLASCSNIRRNMANFLKLSMRSRIRKLNMEFIIEGMVTLALGAYILAPLFMRDRWQALAEQDEASDEIV